MYSIAQITYSNIDNPAYLNNRTHICDSDHMVDDRSNFADTDQTSGYSSSPTIDFAVLPDSEAPHLTGFQIHLIQPHQKSG